MEPIRVKYVVEISEDNVSEAFESSVDQITLEWVRFFLPEDVVQSMGLDVNATPSREARILMLIFLHPTESPIQSIGHISGWEPSSGHGRAGYTVMVNLEEIASEDSQRIREYLEVLQLEREDRRDETHLDGGRFLRQVGRVLETLVDMSEGKREQFGEQFANLGGLRDILGTRSEDRDLGNSICASIEQLGSYIGRTIGVDSGMRKVRIRKLTGKQEAAVEDGTIFVGWEEAPPSVGKNYCVYLDRGGVFRSGTVQQVSENHIRTHNSLYEIQQV